MARQSKIDKRNKAKRTLSEVRRRKKAEIRLSKKPKNKNE